jgi:hypothetical protein
MHILENKAYLMFAERDPLAEKTFWNNHLTLQQRHGHGCSKTTLPSK